MFRENHYSGKNVAKVFLYTALYSIIGMLLFEMLQTALETLASNVVEGTTLSHLYGNMGVFVHYLAWLVCPVGILIGTLGALIIYFAHNWHKRTPIIH